MKKTALIINAVLASALICIYILHFSSQNKVDTSIKELTQETNTLKEKPKVEVIENIEVVEVIEADTIIEEKKEQVNQVTTAYVVLDELMEGWDYYIKKQKKIFDERNKTLNFLNQREQELQQEYSNYIQSLQQELTLEDNSKVQRIQKEALGIQEAKQKISQENYQESSLADFDAQEKLSNVLEDYAKKNGIKHIFSTGKLAGPSVLYSEKSLDITKPILRILNKKYK